MTKSAAHGTANSYANYKCRCEKCKQGMRDYWREYVERVRREHGGVEEFNACGTVRGYQVYGHRDAACRAANAAYARERREARQRLRQMEEMGLLEVNGEDTTPTMRAFNEDHPNATEWDAMQWLESIEAKEGRGWDAFNYSNRAGQVEALKELKRLAG